MTNPSTLFNEGTPNQGGNASGDLAKHGTSKKRRVAELTYPTVEELSRSEELHSSPGKKGGEIELLGAIVVIPPSMFNKKDVLSIVKASVSERHLYYPDVLKGESVSGPIYKISSTAPLKRGIAIRLPFFNENRSNYELKLKWKPDPSDEDPQPCWTYSPTFHVMKGSKGDMVELITDHFGMFVVVSVLKTEKFEITPQGCLYNCNTNRHINIRFPKKYLDKPVTWELVIWPMYRDRCEHAAKTMYVADCSEFIACSDFFEIRSDTYRGEIFRRPVTVRVPLPQHLETEGDNQTERSDLSVLYKAENDTEDWHLVDGPVKFTKDSISFDVKSFSVFVVAQAKPGRGKRLQPAMPRVYQQNFKIQGDIVTFLSLESKKWFIWIEACGLGQTEATARKRTEQSGIDLKYIEYNEEEAERLVEPTTRRSFRMRGRIIPDQPEPVTDNIEFSEGSSLVLDINGDVETVDSDNNSEKHAFYFSEKAQEHYRIFEIRPTTLDERTLTFDVVVSKLNSIDRKYTCVRKQRIEIDEETVKQYFFVEPEPEPEPEPMEVDVTISSDVDLEAERLKAEMLKKTPIAKLQPPMSDAFLRLTTPTKPRNLLCKEPKVLSGKSLQVLSKQIPEGLTLAVYLNVPDSTITGIGFDALSNGFTLNTVTYKILLAWKRKTKPKDKLVEILLDALKDMGRYDVADVVSKKHRENVELVHADFS